MRPFIKYGSIGKIQTKINELKNIANEFFNAHTKIAQFYETS